MTRETKINHSEGSSTNSNSKRRCYECEILFQSEIDTERCSDCSKSTRPFINYNVDHLYLKNVQRACDEVVKDSLVSIKQNQPQLTKRSKISDAKTSMIKRIKLIPDEMWKSLKDGNVGLNRKKKEESDSNRSSNVNIQKQIIPIPSSKNLWEICKKSPQKHDQGLAAKNATLECALIETDVSQQRKELENHEIIDSKDDTVISLLNDFQLVPFNRKPGCTNLELNALIAKKTHLEKLIISCSSDSAEVLSVQKRIRITELESKRLTEEEIIASKENTMKSLERQASQIKCLIDVCKEERDSLSKSAKESIVALELARSFVGAAEKDASEAMEKLDATRDEDFKNYLRYSLDMKKKRVAATTKESVLAVTQLEKAEKDLQDAENDFKTKHASYQEVFEQMERAKSELHCFRDNLASTDQELAFYYSQLKSLSANQVNYRKRFELKKMMLELKFQIEKEELLLNLEIKYDREREELEMETKFTDRFLSLTQ